MNGTRRCEGGTLVNLKSATTGVRITNTCPILSLTASRGQMQYSHFRWSGRETPCSGGLVEITWEQIEDSDKDVLWYYLAYPTATS